MTTKTRGGSTFPEDLSQGKTSSVMPSVKVPVNKSDVFRGDLVGRWFLASWGLDLPKLSHATLRLSSITVTQIKGFPRHLKLQWLLCNLRHERLKTMHSPGTHFKWLHRRVIDAFVEHQRDRRYPSRAGRMVTQLVYIHNHLRLPIKSQCPDIAASVKVVAAETFLP